MVALLLVSNSGVAHGERDKRVIPCISPSSGASLNEVFGVTDQVVTPFCTQVATGVHFWVPTRWFTATTHLLVPPGYGATAPTPAQDFVSKFVSATYVLDAGTRQERTYVVAARELMVRTDLVADGVLAVAWLARLPPLPPGPHSVRLSIVLRAEHWDGLGLDPAVNRLPAGETFWGAIAFTVTPGPPQ
jgi:hypothetical protein